MAKKRKQKQPKVTLEALNEEDSSDEQLPPDEEWDEQAQALHQAMKDGKFDALLEKLEARRGDDEDSIEEVEINDQVSDEKSAEDEEDDQVPVDGESDSEEESASSDEEEEDEKEGTRPPQRERDVESGSEESEEEEKVADKQESDAENSDSDSEDDEKDADVTTNKALRLTTLEYKNSKKTLPWPETFDVSPSTKLPFGPNNDGNPLDVHDDLKREVAFYDVAFEAVVMAKKMCKESNISFSRPEDFFAEMVKTDDHMARVKDRLIFETKKMNAVAQRKSNKEQKFRAKEAQSNKLAEKAKRKREHFEALDEWTKSSASRRGGPIDDRFDREMLQSMEGRNKGPNKKRLAADRKYGYGGKRGRFKQNDPKQLNDPSGFNPRGNSFKGGMKKTKTGSGSNRQGKRARDARRNTK